MGRPSYDISGVAVVTTDDASKQAFDNVYMSANVAKSMLPKILTEVVCTMVIDNIADALEQKIFQRIRHRHFLVSGYEISPKFERGFVLEYVCRIISRTKQNAL